MGFLTWMQSLVPGGDERVAQGQAAEVDANAQRQASLERTPETYLGTQTPLRNDADGQSLDPATGRPYERTTGGTESHDQSGWSWLSETWRRVSGQSTTTSGVNSETGQAITATSTDRATTTLNPNGTASYARDQGTTTQVLDVRGMAGTARRDLEARLADPATPEADRARLQADVARLGAADLDEATLRQIVGGHHVELRPQYRASTGDMEQTRAQVGVQGVGLTGSASSTSIATRADGSSSSSAMSGSAGFDAYAGTARASGQVQQVDRGADGATTTDTVSASGSLAASQGNLTATGGRTLSTATTDASGRVVSGQSDTQTGGATLIAGGSRGTGGGLSSGSDVSTTVDGTTSRTQDQRSIAVTDRGVYAAGSTERTVTGSRFTGGVKSSADGSFTINVTPVAGSAPPQFQVVMQLSGSAGAQLSGGTAPGTATGDAAVRRSTAGAGATGSVQLTYTHVMDEAEAVQYMSEADQAAERGGTAPAHPEFGLASRLHALAEHGDEAGVGAAAVLGSSQAGAMLENGESIDLTLTGDVNASLSGGRGTAAQGGTLGVSGGAGVTRTVRVERTGEADAHGHHMVDVTVTFASRHNLGVTASGTMEGVTVGGGYSSAEGDTHGAMVRLDTDAPDYADKYHQVCAAMTVEEVRALATRLTTGHTETSGATGSVGVAGVTLDVGTSSTTADTVTSDASTGHLSGSVSGSRTDTAGLSAGGIRGVSASERDAATTTVDAGGTETTLETERSSTDAGRSISSGWTALTEWFTGSHTAAERAAAVTTSPQERLRTQLQQTYSSLEQYSLSEGDVNAVVARASDQHEWSRMNSSPRLIEAWEGFRAGLRNPPVNADERAVNETDALRLARGRVMAQWMAARGDEGMQLIIAVLRYWQQRGLSVESAADIGVHLEWPNSLGSVRGDYDLAHGRVRMADDYLGRLVGRADGQSRGRAWYDETRAKLISVQTRVTASTDFEHPRAKMEMLDTIQRQLGELDDAWARNQHALATGEAVSQSDAPAPVAMSRADDVVTVDPAAALQTPAQAAQRRRQADVIAQLAQYKAEERAALARARHLLPRALHGELGDWDDLWHGSWEGAQSACIETADLHEPWIQRVQELRTIYGELGVPHEQWAVSTGPGAPRNHDNEPDMDALYTLYAQTNDGVGANFTMPERRQIANNWRARWTNY